MTGRCASTFMNRQPRKDCTIEVTPEMEEAGFRVLASRM